MSTESRSITFPGRSIDRSAWTAGFCYFVGAAVVTLVRPGEKFFALRPELLAIAAGLAFFFVAVLMIQGHMDLSIKSTGFGEPQKLVTTWVFAYTRNPIYLAFLVPLASLGVLSLASAAISIATYILLMNRWVISREERDLERLFGQAYLDYKAATPRWLF